MADAVFPFMAMKPGAPDILERPLDREVNRFFQVDLPINFIIRAMREREVMDMLVAGNPNKAIADLLGVGVRTVETHRANIMAKLQAKSLSGLVRMYLDFKAI